MEIVPNLRLAFCFSTISDKESRLRARKTAPTRRLAGSLYRAMPFTQKPVISWTKGKDYFTSENIVIVRVRVIKVPYVMRQSNINDDNDSRPRDM